MAIKFKNIVASVDCARLDEREEVRVELTSRGDLVFHNFDRETALAAVELGFEVEDIPCLFIEQNWEFLSSDIRSTSSYKNNLSLPEITIVNAEFAEDYFPDELKKEIKRVKDKIFKSALISIDNSRYNAPTPISVSDDNTRMSISIIGLNPNGRELINANLKRRWDSRCNSICESMDICMYLTIQSYMDVQNLIQDGLVLDRFSKTRAAVVAIDEVLNDSKMIVRAGRQLNNMEIRTRQALVERESPRKKHWSIVSWLS